MHVSAKHSWVKHVDFIIIDFICLNVSMLLAYMIRMSGSVALYGERRYRAIILYVIIIHFCVALFSNSYSDILYRGYFKEFKAVLAHNIKILALMIVVMFATQITRDSDASRFVLFAMFVINVFLTYITHLLWKIVIKNYTKRMENMRHYIVATTPEYMEDAITKLTNGMDRSFALTGIFFLRQPDDEKLQIGHTYQTKNMKEAKMEPIPILGYGGDMYDYACRNIVDGAVVCIGTEKHRKLAEEIAQKFVEMGITVFIKLNFFISDMPNAKFSSLNSAQLISTSMNEVSKLDMAIKRATDIFFGILGCIATGVLYIFLAPAIKISDPKGPVFFKQERAGKGGRVFKMYKFRTMYHDAEERKAELMEKNKMQGLMFKIDGDPRILGSGADGKRRGLGYFIRRFSLDEFPNAFNILKGDMSVVGTRPPTMDEYEKYELRHKSRLAAKPGLTGVWQVSGRSDMTDFEEIVKMDNDYIENWTLGLDIKIMLKTIWVVITRKGSQ